MNYGETSTSVQKTKQKIIYEGVLMHHHGVVLKKLRQLNQEPIKLAAKRIGKSVGWLSGVENELASCRITLEEFERIIVIYGGEKYRKQFSLWIANQARVDQFTDISFDGAVLKYLRCKTQRTLVEVARTLGFSKSYLAKLESGNKPVSLETRNKLLALYGYAPSSFKNFSTEDKRGKNIPIRYKLNILLKNMDEMAVGEIFRFSQELSSRRLES